MSGSPIYWEQSGECPVKVVDVRTLPENVKVAIIQAAIRVGALHEGCAFETIAEGTEQHDALASLAKATAAIGAYMHSVRSLVPREQGSE